MPYWIVVIHAGSTQSRPDRLHLPLPGHRDRLCRRLRDFVSNAIPGCDLGMEPARSGIISEDRPHLRSLPFGSRRMVVSSRLGVTPTPEVGLVVRSGAFCCEYGGRPGQPSPGGPTLEERRGAVGFVFLSLCAAPPRGKAMVLPKPILTPAFSSGLRSMGHIPVEQAKGAVRPIRVASLMEAGLYSTKI